ncbi:MAG: hypothetical protein JW950_09905 [Deltaproteobacteria bacterium]|nr:hypothetical protein [Deltaproteobacteria bacterium]
MHDIIDTEEHDAASEQYWPDRFKEVIRQGLAGAVTDALKAENAFSVLYEKQYEKGFARYDLFIRRIADIVVIGAENGADDMFATIHAALNEQGDLPRRAAYRRSLLPGAFGEPLRKVLCRALADEYGEDHYYEHALEHCKGKFADLTNFMNRIAELVTVGAVNGSEDMLAAVYRSLFYELALPIARRYPKRLKRW